MGIKFLCDTCGKKLNIKEELAGKKGRCPKCDAVIKIPKQSTVSESEKKAATTAEKNQKRASVDAKQTVTVGPAEAKTDDRPVIDVTKNKSGGSPPPVPAAPAEDEQRSSEEVQVDQPIVPPDIQPEAPEDVFAANPAGKWFVRPSSGGQFGPAESDVMKTWLSEGRVGRDSLVWCEGWEEWQSASEIFAEELGGSPAKEKTSSESSQKNVVDSGESVSRDSGSNRAYSHLQARHRARMMGIILVVGLALVSIALAVVLFMVVNNSGNKNDSDKEGNQDKNQSAHLFFAPAKNHNQISKHRLDFDAGSIDLS